MAEDRNMELDWNDSIEKDEGWVELPEGDYDFTIDYFDRSRSKGEGKLPPCNMAVVYFLVKAPDGQEVQIRENFILHRSLEWKLSQLFRSVGMKQKGEKIHMDWNALPGLTGRAHIAPEPSINDPAKKYNRIKELYPKQINKFTPGTF